MELCNIYFYKKKNHADDRMIIMITVLKQVFSAGVVMHASKVVQDLTFSEISVYGARF
jgi:hypothetical protein